VEKVKVILQHGWERAIERDPGVATAMYAGAAIVAEGQRRRIPVGQDGSHGRPGGYARSRIHVEAGADTTGPWWDIGSDAESPDGYPYPVGLELGTRPHVIEVRDKKVLANRRTGQIFGKRVNHPGTKPYPWCRAALADLAGRVL
jgi:hypothetical protein